MSRSISTIVLILLFAASAEASEFQERYVELQRRLKELIALDLPGAGQHRYFLPGTQFESEDGTTRKYADAYARALIRLAQKAASEDPTWTYRLLHEAAYFGEDNLADKVLASKTIESQAKRAASHHPRLGWKRKEYFRVTSPHYQVVTRDPQAGAEIAIRLEFLHAVWRQIFFDCWSNEVKLVSAMENGKRLTPATHRLHRVVLFANQAEYTQFLQKEQPRIGITLGFYDLTTNTSYFYPSDGDTLSTQYHEATHQLFQEIQRTSSKAQMKRNFWIIEGIAMYMESLQRHGDVALIGGPGARRLQFARYRRLQEDFHVPLQELVSFGRIELQQAPAIRQIYSQSAGLTHFLMDANQQRRRDGLIQYLRTIYAGRDRIDALVASLGEDLRSLDDQYARYLRIGDEELIAAQIPSDSLRALCLGGTSVTDRALQALAPQSKLEWLDLAGLPIDSKSLGFLSQSRALEQVNLDRCKNIGDEAMPIIAQNPGLDELDVSGTQVTDKGLEQFAGHPSLTTLWISNTRISDASIPIIAKLPALSVLACKGSRITEKGLRAIKNARPDLKLVE